MRTIIISLFESPSRRCYSAKRRSPFATKHEHALTPLRRFILPTLAFGLMFAVTVQAQVGSSISADGSAPNNNAMLDVQSPATGDGKGILIPRITVNQRTNAISAPDGGLLDNSGNLRGGAAQGLIVYQTDGTQGLYFNTSQSATPAWVYLGAYTETDPLWTSASNGIVADIAIRLASNVWAAAGSTTNYLPRTGGTMSGALNMGAQIITNVAHVDFSANNVSVGRGANGATYGAAVGYYANGYNYGAAVGWSANGFTVGAAVGEGANGTNAGAAMGALANGATYGAAMGITANGSTLGVALGYLANGARTNVAIGAFANAQGGTQRIAIGNDVTNTVENTAVIRGTLYLDGGTGVMTRATFGGAGAWTAKAFEIDHPLDPANKVLRHYCLESPQVWNVYAGNAQLVNGQAVIELPEYYSALNLVGSEIYSLTPIGGWAPIWVQEKVSDNKFVIAGQADLEISWTLKVLRNDPGCLEDLRRRPVEQRKSELETGN